MDNTKLYSEISKLKAGEQQAYYDIYNLTSNYVYKLIYDITQDGPSSDAIIQDVYTTMYNRINEVKDEKKFYSWINKIATDATLKYLTNAGNFSIDDITSDGYTSIDSQHTGVTQIPEAVSDDTEAFIPESILTDTEKQRICKERLDKLPPSAKIILQYYYYENLSVDEIVQILNCPRDIVIHTLCYIRETLKEIIGTGEASNNFKLYNLASLPLIFMLFESAATNVPLSTLVLGTGAIAAAGTVGSVTTAVSGTVASGAVGSVTTAATGTVASGAVGSVTTAATGTVGSAASGVAAAKVGIGLGTKVAICVAGTAIVAGGGIAASMLIQKEPNPTETTQATVESFDACIWLHGSYPVYEYTVEDAPVVNTYENFLTKQFIDENWQDINSQGDYQVVSNSMYELNQTYGMDMFKTYFIENYEKMLTENFETGMAQSIDITDRFPESITYDMNGKLYNLDITSVTFYVSYTSCPFSETAATPEHIYDCYQKGCSTTIFSDQSSPNYDINITIPYGYSICFLGQSTELSDTEPCKIAPPEPYQIIPSMNFDSIEE